MGEKSVLRRDYAEFYRAICENIESSIPGIKIACDRKPMSIIDPHVVGYPSYITGCR